MRVVCGIRLAFQAERCRFEPCSPLQFKKVYMFSRFFRPKEQWRLVKTFTEAIERRLTKEEGIAYFHLFESDRGARRVEFSCSLSHSNNTILAENMKRLDMYQQKIYRWEMGRLDPEIPRYSDIPQEETAVALRGKVV